MSLRVTTDRQVSGLKPADRPYEVAIEKSRGLCVRVFPTGVKQFEFRYVTTSGCRRRHRLGGYPGLSLAQARASAAVLGVDVINGKDPAAERVAERDRARTGDTLTDLAEAYWQAATKGLHGGRKRPKRASTIRHEQAMWRNHVARKLGDRPFAAIRRADIKVFMRELATSSGLAPASVASVGAVVQAVLGFAVEEERLEANPAIGLARPLSWSSRERLFTDDALAVIFRAALIASTPRTAGEPSEDIHARMSPETGLAIRLLMLTLTRRSEVTGARWREFDMTAKQWTIPSDRAKANHIHIVPLTPDMMEVLATARALHPSAVYLFPAAHGEGDHLDARIVTRAFARICRRHRLESGSPHDVRRSGATTLVGRYGVQRLVVGKLLGHTANEGAAVTSVYDRHTYLPEKRAALETWGDHLRRLECSAGLQAAHASKTV